MEKNLLYFFEKLLSFSLFMSGFFHLLELHIFKDLKYD